MIETAATYSIQPLLAVAASFLAVPLIMLFGKRPNMRETWTFAAAIIKFILVFLMLGPVLNGEILEIRLWSVTRDLSLHLKVDPLGLFFGLVASSLWILTSIYSVGYMRALKSPKQTRYYASFAVCLGSTLGIAFAGNLVTFLIFYEILSIATYPLVIHKETPEAMAAGRKYLVYALSAGVLLLLAVALTYALTGSAEFQPGGFLQHAGLSNTTLCVLLALFVLGIGVKAALMPLHGWLPVAMAAPTPVSALLHAVAVVKAGAFGIIRVVWFVFGPEALSGAGLDRVLACLAVFTFTAASLIALRQTKLKRRLAYSTIGHLSYIVLGAALLTPYALMGALLHLVFHAMMKITLFFCAGAIYAKTHLERISDLDGLGRRMPFTFGAFAIAAAGLAGIPPVCGFISKWYLGKGALDAGEYGFLVFLLLSGLLNAAYFFPIVIGAFFAKPRVDAASGPIAEADMMLRLPLIITACASIAFGIAPNAVFHFVDLARLTVQSLFGGFL